MNETLQRIAITITLGLALVTMGHTIDSWEFWAVIAMMLVSTWLHYMDGVETGVSNAVEMWVDMTEEQRKDMIELVTKARAED
jgi:F0F1-type ATP synthase membrane subunit a